MSFYGKIPKRSELGTVSLNSILHGLDMFFLMYLRKQMSANALIKMCPLMGDTKALLIRDYYFFEQTCTGKQIDRVPIDVLKD